MGVTGEWLSQILLTDVLSSPAMYPAHNRHGIVIGNGGEMVFVVNNSLSMTVVVQMASDILT